MEIDPTPSPRPVAHDADAHDPNVGVYDGIHEHNNPLPRWWQWIFWGAAVFALIYWLDYEGLKAQPYPREEYAKEAAAAAQAALAKGAIKFRVSRSAIERPRGYCGRQSHVHHHLLAMSQARRKR